MASIASISVASAALEAHLRAAFDAPDWRTGVPVVCRTVEAFVRANDPAGQLLVWLLHAGPDPGARYDPMPSPGKSSGRRPELALGLQYLVAAQADDALRAQDILSRVLLRLHRRPRVSVASDGASAPLAFAPEPTSLTDLVSIWHAVGFAPTPSLVCRTGVSLRE